jgi:hydroxymethylpyrimidine/phosphomethylpyrimidine kinase
MTEAAQAKTQAAKPPPRNPIALSIAGFDPSSGAGITADLKVFAAHDIYGMACISALTLQSTLGVRRVEPIAPETIRETLDCLLEDITPDGVKIGMLATEPAVAEVARFLAQSGIPRDRVVLDPVVRSSSGRELLSPAGVDRLRSELLPLIAWITPNSDELAALTEIPHVFRDKVADAAIRLQELARGAGNSNLHVIATGGHFEKPDDLLLLPDGSAQWLEGERVETQSTHGTGCAFSSALLCQLIHGAEPLSAAKSAKEYVTAALKAAYPVGHGKGPMHHLFMRRRGQ